MSVVRGALVWALLGLAIACRTGNEETASSKDPLAEVGPPSAASAADSGTGNAQSIDAFVAAQMTTHHREGVQVALLENGTTVFSKGYGKADVTRNVAVDERTIFPVSSMSKVVMDVAVPCGTYFHAQNFLPEAPGTQYLYSSVASSIAAVVVRAQINVSFEEWTRAHVFEPLGMNETAWRLSGFYPAASLRSTAVDYAKLVGALTNDGTHAGGRLLAAATMTELRRVQNKPLDSDAGPHVLSADRSLLLRLLLEQHDGQGQPHVGYACILHSSARHPNVPVFVAKVRA